MGKTILKGLVSLLLGAACYLAFIPLFTLVQQHSSVSHDWILNLSAEMQIYAVYAQNLITELIVAVPLIMICGTIVGFISDTSELKFGMFTSTGIIFTYTVFFYQLRAVE